MNLFCKTAGVIAFSVLAMNVGSAAASTSKQWQAALAQTQTACAKASGLRDAKALGEPALFDDSSPQTALLIRGTYPQAHMKGQAGTMLCLYDRKSRRARAVEWAPPAQ